MLEEEKDVVTKRKEEEKDINILVEDITDDRVMDANYKRHSWHQTTTAGPHELNDKLIVRSRYLSGSFGSCHDLCKQGHKNELEIKMMAPPVRKVMLRTQSERKYLPEVCGTKSALKRLSLPETRVEKQSRLYTKEIKDYGNRQGSNEIKGVKKPLVSSSCGGREIVVVKNEEKPILPLSASCKSKPPTKRAMTMDARNKKVGPSSESTPLKKQLPVTEGRTRVGTGEGTYGSCFTKSMLPTIQRAFRVSKPEGRAQRSVEPKAKEKRKPEHSQTGEKGSSTWKMKFKKATATVLSGGSISPKKLIFGRPESASEDQNGVTIDDGKGSYKSAEVDREEPHENGDEPGEVVVLRHHETTEKNEDNVIKESDATESLKCKKDRVKALVGAFEALISFGDRKSLVAASAS